MLNRFCNLAIIDSLVIIHLNIKLAQMSSSTTKISKDIFGMWNNYAYTLKAVFANLYINKKLVI